MRFLMRRPIKTQLMILAASTAVIVLVIIFTAYFQIASVIRKNNSEYTKNLFFQIKQSMLANHELFNRILTNIAYNSGIQDFILEDDDFQRYTNAKKVENFLRNIEDLKQGIEDIIILGNNGNSYFLNVKSAATESIIKSLPDNISNYYSGTVSLVYGNREHLCFIVSSPIYSIDPNKMTSKKIGTVSIILDADAFGIQIDKMPENSSTKFYLLDRNNIVYSSNDADSLNTGFDKFKDLQGNQRGELTKINNRNFLVNVDEIPGVDGKIISVVPETDLLAGIADSRNLAVEIFVIALIILSIPFSFIINNILHPLKKFMSFLASLKSGNLKHLKKRIHLEGYTEISVMSQEFNSMLDEVDSLTRRLLETNSRLYETELEKKQSELAFLQGQINPHFLYNTLESIIGIAAVEGNFKIMDMAKSLGRVFHYSVKGGDIVELKEELNIVKAYIQIQKIRFTDRFDVYYQFYEEDVLECLLPKMLLQPIVENSIYHGLEPKLGKGHLWINAWEEEEQVFIAVKDDGVGMDTCVSEEINRALSENRAARNFTGSYKTGLGVVNVNNRIKLTYGDQYGITMNSRLDRGTEVILNIPVRR